MEDPRGRSVHSRRGDPEDIPREVHKIVPAPPKERHDPTVHAGGNEDLGERLDNAGKKSKIFEVSRREHLIRSTVSL